MLNSRRVGKYVEKLGLKVNSGNSRLLYKRSRLCLKRFSGTMNMDFFLLNLCNVKLDVYMLSTRFLLMSFFNVKSLFRFMGFYVKKSNLKKNVYFFFNKFKEVSVTSKAKGVRMGKGKGGFERRVFVIQPGEVICGLKFVGDCSNCLLFDKMNFDYFLDNSFGKRFCGGFYIVRSDN